MKIGTNGSGAKRSVIIGEEATAFVAVHVASVMWGSKTLLVLKLE